MTKDRAYYQQRLDDNVTKAADDLLQQQRTFRRSVRARVAAGKPLTADEIATSAHGRRLQYAILERATRLADDYRNGGRG